MSTEFLRTCLLVLGNSLLGIVIYYMKDMHEFIKDTRSKLDLHCENFDLHNPDRRKK